MNREDTKAWTLRFERPYFAKHFDADRNEFRLLGKKEELWRTSIWEVEVSPFDEEDSYIVAVLNSCDMDENIHLLDCFAGEKEAHVNDKAWALLEFAAGHELHRKRNARGDSTWFYRSCILGWCYKHKEPYVKLV